MPDKVSALAAACLSVGLASAWTPHAKANVSVDVTIEADFVGDVTNAIFLLSTPDASSGGSAGFVISDPALLGGTIPREGWLTFIRFDGVAADNLGVGYAMLGLTQRATGERSLVVTGDHLTIVLGVSFEEAFPGFSEGELIHELLTGGAGGEAFLRSNFAALITPYGAESTATAFTLGEPFGSMTLSVAVVPAPSAAAAVVTVGLIGLARRRRRP